MKLNLPLTLTSQKISFLLSILFNPFQLKGDEQFKECLDDEQTIPAGANRTGLYNTINSFGSNHPADKINFCCDILLKCEVMSPPTECPFLSPPRIFTQCDSINNFNNLKFCISYGSSSLPSSICGGILGNANPIDIEGSCPSPDTIRNTLNTSQQTIPNKFSWLCCKNENCNVPAVNVKFKDSNNLSATQEATTSCARDEYSLMCFRDNKVWICTGNIGSTISIWPNPIGSCLVQVSLNSSTPLPPSSTATLSPTTSASPTTSPSPVIPGDNKNDTMIIRALSGAVIIIIIVIIGFLVYKWLKKWRIRREVRKILENLRIFSTTRRDLHTSSALI